MIAKAGLGLIGLGALGVGGAAIAKPEWFGISSAIPPYNSLASRADLNGKWVKDYKSFFVSENSQDWFKWAFKNRYEKEEATNKKTKFSGLTKGSGGSNSLSNACKLAYGAESNNVKTNANQATGDNNFLEENIWRYCSVGGTKLKTVQEASQDGNYTGNLGSTHKDVLLAAEGDSNDWAWHIKQKEFLKGAAPASGVFKKFHESNQTYKNEEKGTRLRDECRRHYGQKESSESPENDSTLKADALKKYCSLKVDETGI